MKNIEFYHIDAMEAPNYEPIWKALQKLGVDSSLVAVPQSRNSAGAWFDFERLAAYYRERNIPFSTSPGPSSIGVTTQNEDILRDYQSLHLRLMYGPVVYPLAWGLSEKAARPFDIVMVHGPKYVDLLSQWQPRENLLDIGYPKYDALFAGLLNPKELKTTWGIDQSRPTVLYLPTWDYNSSLDRFVESVASLSSEYNVIVKPHHCTVRMEPQRMDALRRSGVTLSLNSYDLADLFAIADVVLSDARSSSLCESLVADRRTIGMVADPREMENWIRPSGLTVASAFCTDPRQLRAYVARSLDHDEFKDSRRVWSDQYVSYRDGTAGEKAARLLVEHLDRRVSRTTVSVGASSAETKVGGDIRPPEVPRKKRNIIWLLLDGLRPDKLFSCGNEERPRLFIDELMLSGTLFDNMYTAHGCSKTSCYAAFTSMYGASNGVNGYTYENFRRFDAHALSLTDHLKRAGYTNFRYCDKNDRENKVTPKSGFDVWESSGYKFLQATPNYSFDLPARRTFIDQYNNTDGPKFLFMHFLLLHDLMGDAEGYHWKSTSYEKCIHAQSQDVQLFLQQFKLEPDDLLVLSTDHGITLDRNRVEYTQQNGLRMEDWHFRVFCSLVGKSIPKTKTDRLVRTIDIAPTLLDLIGAEPMGAQGTSLVPLMEGKPFQQLQVMMARDSAYENPPWSDSPCTWSIRTEDWKYVVHRWRKEGNWFMNVREHGDYQVNLLGQGLPQEKELDNTLRTILIDSPKKPEEIYAETGQKFRRVDIEPVTTVVMPVQTSTPGLAETIYSVLDQIGPYFELVIVDADEGGETNATIQSIFPEHPYIRYHRIKAITPAELVNFGVSVARGAWLTLVAPDGALPEDHLYSFYQVFAGSQNLQLVLSLQQSRRRHQSLRVCSDPLSLPGHPG